MTYALVNDQDGVKWTGAANNQTIGPFTLLGGKYGLASYSSTTNSVTLEILGPDGSTYIAAGAAQTANYATYDLPAGAYEIVGGAAYGTGQGSLTKVPYNPKA
jgi:hypothetical protein